VFVAEGCNWQSGRTCTIQTPNGRLGRRTSGLLAPPQDQGSCGSCWAFAATNTYTDTSSIRANQRTDLLSSQYPMTCTTQVSNGCCGAYLFSGCTQPTQANINSAVFMHLNGTFEIVSSSYQHLVGGGAAATSGNLFLLLAATIMAVLTIGCY